MRLTIAPVQSRIVLINASDASINAQGRDESNPPI